MLKHDFSLILSLTLGAFCSLPVCVFAQDPIEIPMPSEDATSSEEVAADVLPMPEEPLSDDEYETLTRGPLHEAFAEPVVADPVPGLVVPQEPPLPIEELSPEYRPESEDAIWIAGYWGWDEERADFIWISGVYRVPPQGHQWVPGYWNQVNDGWQWVQGFWIEDMAESIVYMPPPPATLENGPSSPSPGVDYFYIPGNWTQSSTVSTGYVWSTGYWHPMQSDFVWIPAHFVWTPRGCVYVNGYWDERLPMRGFCFAPVSIPRTIYNRPGWRYRPSVVLNSQVVLHNLFIQPRYNHYLFGDYYGLPSTNRHVVPAYVYHQRRGSCDPLISFYSAYNARQGHDLIKWYGNQQADFIRNPSHRPPQVWSPKLQQSQLTIGPGKDHSNMAHRLDQLNLLTSGPRVSAIPNNGKQEIVKRDLDIKRLAKSREESERKFNHSDAASKNNIAAQVQAFSLPKYEPKVRNIDPSSKVKTLPEAPRSAGRDRLNLDSIKKPDRVPRDNNIGQDLRRLDPLPNKIEPKRDEVPRNDANLSSKSLESNRIRPADALKNTLPRNFNPTNPTIPPRAISPPTNNDRNRDNGPPRNPNLDSRKPNIEINRPNLIPPNLNIETRKLNVPTPLPNRQPNSNENPQRSNRGGGPIEKPQNNSRTSTPVQPVVPKIQEQPKLRGSNASTARSIQPNERQGRPGIVQNNSAQNNSRQRTERGNPDRGEASKKRN